MVRTQLIYKKKGVTLIELLVALTILGIVIGAVYRLFIVQTRAYTVQDQVVEVQQNIRGAMEILLRDLRMTGFDEAGTPGVVLVTSLVPGDNSITVGYEHNGAICQVRYRRDAVSEILFRDDGSGEQPLLENVEALNFTYGIDTPNPATGDLDGCVNSWVDTAGVGSSRVIAVNVTLTVRPDPTRPDVQKMVSNRTLTSAVTFRNLIMK
jgi:prepilin-type N-terminal cleavage/methylation domain-containing protein